MKRIFLSLSILLSTFSTINVNAAEKINLSSLDWPPYVSESLANKGFISEAVSAALEKAGYTTHIQFLPWERAISSVVTDNTSLAYYPGYLDDCVNRKALASDPIGSGPLNFIQNVKKPIAWNTLQDLKGKMIGVVTGYVNTPEFDTMVSKRELTTQPVKDDLTNMIKLENGRLDAAVIDGNLFQYTLSQHPELKNLALNEKKLADQPLYVCFKDSDKGKMLVEAFNAALKTLDLKKMQQDYLDKLMKH